MDEIGFCFWEGSPTNGGVHNIRASWLECDSFTPLALFGVWMGVCPGSRGCPSRECTSKPRKAKQVLVTQFDLVGIAERMSETWRFGWLRPAGPSLAVRCHLLTQSQGRHCSLATW